MTQPVRQVIDAALDSWLHDDHNRAPTRTDAILAALAAAGYVIEHGWQRIDWERPETQPPEWPASFLCLFPDGTQCVFNRHQMSRYEITHWRPLPAPPKEAKP